MNNDNRVFNNLRRISKNCSKIGGDINLKLLRRNIKKSELRNYKEKLDETKKLIDNILNDKS